MSKLLLDEHPLLVLPSLAKSVGLNEAIFIQQIHYWLHDSKHLHEGRYWTYNSIRAWLDQFPFWSARTLRRIVESLERSGLIITGNFNRDNRDRTIWYSINYDALDKMHVAKMAMPNGQNGHVPHVAKMAKPLPETTHETSTKTSKTHGAVAPVVEITLPHGVAFSSAWTEWMDYRRSKRKPVSIAAARKQLETLAAVSEAEAVAAINKAISSDWQGIFLDKRRKTTSDKNADACRAFIASMEAENGN